jgi:hypothetical protein
MNPRILYSQLFCNINFAVCIILLRQLGSEQSYWREEVQVTRILMLEARAFTVDTSHLTF